MLYNLKLQKISYFPLYKLRYDVFIFYTVQYTYNPEYILIENIKLWKISNKIIEYILFYLSEKSQVCFVE